MSGAGKGKITVLVPVYECAERFAGHLTTVRALHQAGMALVWVVTASRDGSDRLARQAHAELGGKWLEAPPGLYEAWNAGIREATSEFIYISTVGETVLPRGLILAQSTLQYLGADVYFTPPILPSNRIHRKQLLQWPVYRFHRELKAREGKVLSRFFLARIQAVAGIFSLLGSCASCLFRTAYLQSHPFPTDYFHYGDAAWVYQNHNNVRMVFSAKPIATFFVHGPLGRTVGKGDVERLRGNFFKTLRAVNGGEKSLKALKHWCTASRYLDNKRGRRPKRFWWLNYRMLFVWLIRNLQKVFFTRSIKKLDF